MLAEDTTVPVANSTTDGTPIPTPSSGSSPRTSAIRDTNWSISASELSSFVGCTVASESLVPRSSDAATFVPPTSTPMNDPLTGVRRRPGR